MMYANALPLTPAILTPSNPGTEPMPDADYRHGLNARQTMAVLLAIWVPAGIVSLFFGAFNGQQFIERTPVVIQARAYAALENHLAYRDAYERLEAALAYEMPLINHDDLLRAIRSTEDLSTYTVSEAAEITSTRRTLIGYLHYFPDAPVVEPLLDWVEPPGAQRLVDSWYAAGYPGNDLALHKTIRTIQVRQMASHALFWLHHPRSIDVALTDYLNALTTITMNPGIYRDCSPGNMSAHERLPIGRLSFSSYTLAHYFHVKAHGPWPQNYATHDWWDDNRDSIMDYYDALVAAADLSDAP